MGLGPEPSRHNTPPRCLPHCADLTLCEDTSLSFVIVRQPLAIAHNCISSSLVSQDEEPGTGEVVNLGPCCGGFFGVAQAAWVLGSSSSSDPEYSPDWIWSDNCACSDPSSRGDDMSAGREQALYICMVSGWQVLMHGVWVTSPNAWCMGGKS